MKPILRTILRAIYGVRGGLRPPLGTLGKKTIRYRLKYNWWRLMGGLYEYSELPQEWWNRRTP